MCESIMQHPKQSFPHVVSDRRASKHDPPKVQGSWHFPQRVLTGQRRRYPFAGFLRAFIGAERDMMCKCSIHPACR